MSFWETHPTVGMVTTIITKLSKQFCKASRKKGHFNVMVSLWYKPVWYYASLNNMVIRLQMNIYGFKWGIADEFSQLFHMNSNLLRANITITKINAHKTNREVTLFPSFLTGLFEFVEVIVSCWGELLVSLTFLLLRPSLLGEEAGLVSCWGSSMSLIFSCSLGSSWLVESSFALLISVTFCFNSSSAFLVSSSD